MLFSYVLFLKSLNFKASLVVLLCIFAIYCCVNREDEEMSYN